jgi:hypothetical protein
MYTSNEEKLNTSVFFVEADSYSKHQLWKAWHESTDWKQDSSGFLREIGYIGKTKKRAVCVQFNFAMIHGKRVCFYNATSRFVDHDMVEEYIQENWPVKYDNGSRKAMCDADGFHNCIEVCKNL